MFSIFKKKAKETTTQRVFFGKDATYFKYTGSLLANSRKHGIKEESIRFSVLEPHLEEDASLTEALITLIFDEARNAGYEPLALTQFFDTKFYRISPNQINRLKRLIPRGEDPAAFFATVKAHRLTGDESRICDLHLSASNIDQDLLDTEGYALTPEFVNLSFNLAREIGYTPISFISNMSDVMSELDHEEELVAELDKSTQYDEAVTTVLHPYVHPELGDVTVGVRTLPEATLADIDSSKIVGVVQDNTELPDRFDLNEGDAFIDARFNVIYIVRDGTYLSLSVEELTKGDSEIGDNPFPTWWEDAKLLYGIKEKSEAPVVVLADSPAYKALQAEVQADDVPVVIRRRK